MQKYMFLWSQFKVRVLNRFEIHLCKNWSVSFSWFKCCVPEDANAVVKIKLKEDFHILEINSCKVSKSYNKIMVAIFDTSVVWSGEGVRVEELDDKDKALEGALKWSVSKVTSALTLGQSMPFSKNPSLWILTQEIILRSPNHFPYNWLKVE